jgi:hypothetical protein
MLQLLLLLSKELLVPGLSWLLLLLLLPLLLLLLRLLLLLMLVRLLLLRSLIAAQIHLLWPELISCCNDIISPTVSSST